MIREDFITDARECGREAALAAASWILDGNAPDGHYARLLATLNAGDPVVYDFLPVPPALSGEWAGDPTPLNLAREITGEDNPADGLIDALADAWEYGRDDAFIDECERLLIEATK